MASSASYRVMLNTTDLHYNNTDALREWLRAHKLPVSGKKAVLIAR